MLPLELAAGETAATALTAGIDRHCRPCRPIRAMQLRFPLRAQAAKRSAQINGPARYRREGEHSHGGLAPGSPTKEDGSGEVSTVNAVSYKLARLMSPRNQCTIIRTR